MIVSTVATLGVFATSCLSFTNAFAKHLLSDRRCAFDVHLRSRLDGRVSLGFGGFFVTYTMTKLSTSASEKTLHRNRSSSIGESYAETKRRYGGYLTHPLPAILGFISTVLNQEHCI